MKKLLAIILAGTMLFGLAACGKTETPNEDTMPENMALSIAEVFYLTSISAIKGG